MPSKPHFAQVAINVPLSRLFDYRLATDLPIPALGARVRVPFGRREQIGVVLGLSDTSDLPASKLRAIKAVVDAEPLLSDLDLQLLRFCADYYHHPVGEVVSAALPALLRQGKPLAAPIQRFAVTSETPEDLDAVARRAPKQAELLRAVAPHGSNGLPAPALEKSLSNWRPTARALLKKNWLRHFEADADSSWPAPAAPQPGPALNPEQTAATQRMLAGTGFGVFVLDGVTGSGKTEVYLQLMQAALAEDRQVLVLVPEIGLTPQLLKRLGSRLGEQPALLHSALTDVERLTAWRAARDASAKIVVGTRSAVFTPMPRLGLIIIDEEHDPSLKQQEGLRYSARDLAITRAKLNDATIVLGSATPTLEVLQHARSGQFERLRLVKRAGGAAEPRVGLADISSEHTEDGLGSALLAAMRSHLEAGGQVLLFLNRRGFAPTLICSDCGHVAECRRCDSRLTVHAEANELRCHHCGASRVLDVDCESCGSLVRPLGEGTERIESSVRLQFPDRTIQRIDSDTTQRKGAIDAALLAAEQGDADILIGTQMLSKGHHFPQLTLVGIVNADQGLFGTDFRSAERMAQSVIQVAGRAGREDRQGEVLIQTAFPEHRFWRTLLDGGYREIAEQALAERERSGWPPFSRLALLRASAHRRDDAMAFLGEASHRLARYHAERLTVLGPVDAPLARKAGRYRGQLLLQSNDRARLHHALRDLRPWLEARTSGRKVRWSFDVDPIELF